ncbi:MAG: hypothetical protein IIB57_03260 [Planctomycetes bacterium]|nr:hypothetical protein [Planctomycetota bacterium]
MLMKQWFTVKFEFGVRHRERTARILLNRNIVNRVFSFVGGSECFSIEPRKDCCFEFLVSPSLR